MDQGSFDFYRQERPMDDAEKIGVIDQGEQAGTKKPPAQSFFRRYRIIIIAAGCCLLFLLTIPLMAVLPSLDKVDLEVSISYSGSSGGDTMYVDTDDIWITIKNNGRETAYGDKISLSVSGDNIVGKEIKWWGGDIGPGKKVGQTISVEVQNEFEPFTLWVYVGYDGGPEDHDKIPY